MLFDYETLKLIWWALVGVLLIGFAITDGFDMGACALLPLLGKNDIERRVVINTVGPHWEGNQVWFITAGGAIFAAWPAVYAAAFSGFYWAMLLVLFALFFRPVGFDYRSKIADPRWRSAWDWGLVIGGTVPALVFGVAFGNLLLGVPFQHDEFLRPSYQGNLFGLLNPFGLLSGVVSLGMLSMHGAVWVHLRSEGKVRDRARRLTQICALITLAAFALAGIWLSNGIDGYQILSAPPHDALPNPLTKEVIRAEGAWLANYATYPATLLAPVIGFAGLITTFLLAGMRCPGWAFLTSSLAMAGIILTAGFSLFPFVMPSSLEPNSSLTLWDASSSHLTLNVMTYAAIIFVPIVLGYTLWCYRALWGRTSVEFIQNNDHSTY
ncbi:Cytochrome d ubiquinol oxidase subunit II [Marinobacterium lacunae]|uniref:Cytochrome d ubiquinol oxidase subunit II n=1 Tax=Marinobacterium lacunae TaxID=1232683 RepID=A0A081FWE9_9GAMM|nr:cytochrome d ubiquinol oxidase subunit II [Marinobacterium lacunae]KEA62854.1 Cytochrome d ubiquinol oxidase subunit II [Marinobacterium lacunae]MBR9883674.1 cytochrome d ubiquinol oxidase subunit II [Oceanospirillales bacterium]